MRAPIQDLDQAEFDVVVIGAGVNGASTAEKLSAAGYRVLIVDKGDFATGASSRSSRLLHCGLRYLAPGRSILDFARHPSRLKVAMRMARLAMQSRSEFVHNKGHRTQAIRLHFPIYRDGPYRNWQVDLAFRILGALGPGDVPLDYRRLTPEEARSQPLIDGLRDFDRLQGVAAFREYQFHWPERIAIDAVVEAEKTGATARNYTSARMVSHQAGQGWSIELTDMLDQSAPVTVRGKCALVMAGVWIDDVLKAGKPTAGRKIFGTKGAHIVVRLPAECRGLGIATLNSLNEPFYCIPWNDLHYFGPTETEYTDDQDNVHVTEQEMAFLIGEANRLLPGLKLTPADVMMTWAGVRPLTYDEAVPFGNRSRVVHDLSHDGLPDAFAMTAGPVMSHRSSGEEMTALVRSRIAPTRAEAAPAPRPVPSAGEHAERLSDIIFRRSGRGWAGPVPEEELARIAAEAGSMLGWDEQRIARETKSFEEEWVRLYRPRLR